MDLTLFKDLGQIFAWSVAGAFFAYRFYTGWFHPNVGITLNCVRQRAPIGTALAATDFLTVLATIKKGSNMTVRLLDLQARITFGEDAADSRRHAGPLFRCALDLYTLLSMADSFWCSYKDEMTDPRTDEWIAEDSCRWESVLA